MRFQIDEGHQKIATFSSETESVLYFMTERNEAFIYYITDGWSSQQFIYGFGMIYTAIEGMISGYLYLRPHRSMK